MLCSTRTRCHDCRRLRAKMCITRSFVIPWISSGHWATKAHVSASAGCQAIVTLWVMAKETLDHDIYPLTSVHYADLKSFVHSCIQQRVSMHGRDVYIVKPTLRPPDESQHLTRDEEVVVTRLRLGHTKAKKSHILSRGPPTILSSVTRLWPSNTWSWSVQCYNKVVLNTTLLIH